MKVSSSWRAGPLNHFQMAKEPQGTLTATPPTGQEADEAVNARPLNLYKRTVRPKTAERRFSKTRCPLNCEKELSTARATSTACHYCHSHWLASPWPLLRNATARQSELAAAMMTAGEGTALFITSEDYNSGHKAAIQKGHAE